MSALAKALPVMATRVETEAAAPTLSGLFAEIARSHPGRLAVGDQSRRDIWSGRPQVEWTYGWAKEMLSRFSAYLRSLSLPDGSPVGVCLANSSESYLTILAVERAGLTPCLLPLTWPEEKLSSAVTATRMQAVVTQGVVGEDRPAETFCKIQAAAFRLRYVLAFGPELPDGAVDLDRVLMDPWLSAEDEGDEASSSSSRAGGLITFSRQGDGIRPLLRTTESLIAAAQAVVATTRSAVAERIVTLMAPDDCAGLVTGLASALVVRASLECHGVFGAASLIDSLEDPTPARLVAPGWLEEALAEFDPPASISPVLVHQAPFRFKQSTPLKNGVVDVLAFDEAAVLASPRSTRGLFALPLDRERAEDDRRRPIRVKIAADGSMLFSGLASEVAEFQPDRPGPPVLPDWRPSGFSAERRAGVVVGVA